MTTSRRQRKSIYYYQPDKDVFWFLKKMLTKCPHTTCIQPDYDFINQPVLPAGLLTLLAHYTLSVRLAWLSIYYSHESHQTVIRLQTPPGLKTKALCPFLLLAVRYWPDVLLVVICFQTSNQHVINYLNNFSSTSTSTSPQLFERADQDAAFS